ncbi:hypothetical protein Y602_3777 [Burkholderia pseudomallei MSHR733]|nr:hypothetical protein Y602_3777 [Burkholderia pseudomallei MSHR733]
MPIPSWKRRGSGEPSTSRPNAPAPSPSALARSAISATDSAAPLAAGASPSSAAGGAATGVSHCAASKPVFAPQYGVARLFVKRRTSSPTLRAKSACA